MNCCSDKPVIQLPAGEKLCKNHFTDYFEDKVFKTIRQIELLDKEENLGVALSGGKDSLTVLHILNKLSKQNPKIKINAIAIDEGIHNYRDKTLEKAKEFCHRNNIKLNIFSYKGEFGLTLDEMLKILDVKPCTVCGIFRRYLLNKKSRESGLTKLVTGHNLDDECQSIIMNQMKNNIRSSARLGPKVGLIQDEMSANRKAISVEMSEREHRSELSHVTAQKPQVFDKFVQRIKPLYLCAEKEVTTYAFVNGLLDEFNECPNVPQSFRAQVRDMLNSMEQKFPGTKYSIVNSFLETLPLLKQDFKNKIIKVCQRCSEPSANDICNACVYLGKLRNSFVEIK